MIYGFHLSQEEGNLDGLKRRMTAGSFTHRQRIQAARGDCRAKAVSKRRGKP
jgi:hypothetical protein